VDTTTITFDKPRTLKLDVNALCALEERTQLTSLQVYNLILESSVRMTVEAIAAALLHEDPSMTGRKAQPLVAGYFARGGTIQELGAALLAAFKESQFFFTVNDAVGTATPVKAGKPRGKSAAKE
jgi:hypothetical protein